MAQQHTFQPPTGTRDFYPQEMLRRRYIEKAWRDASIRHGFEEIDGPTFEHLDLYTVKSGEGIVSELFSFERFGGEKTYALRPEFTPTLARMYASKANALPKPTKWFTSGPFFRAERPQRGRLREFLQWNVDVLGDDSPRADAEAIACCVEFLRTLGYEETTARVKMSERGIITNLIVHAGLDLQKSEAFLEVFDARAKLSVEELRVRLLPVGVTDDIHAKFTALIASIPDALKRGKKGLAEIGIEEARIERCLAILHELNALGIAEWCDFPDFTIVRGLAYYTGMVFEVHEAGGKERAIAGGGRYDNLIELFGGPPTPAVGFGMGDVVLSLVLQDRGLMPEGKALLEALSKPSPSLRPDAFVVATEAKGADTALAPTLAALRRENLHARRSYKATKNPGKLIKDAAACHARNYVVIDSAESCTLKNLDTGEQHPQPVPLAELPGLIAGRR